MARKTAPLRLRPLASGDLDALVRWRNDPIVRDHLVGHRMPVSRAMEQDWLDRAMRSNPHEVHFAIERQPGRFIGIASLRAIDWIVRHARLGMMIGEATDRGRGYGREALAQVLRFAFRDINLERVHLHVADFNTPALRLYRSAGFVQEGTLRAHAWGPEGPCDLHLFGLMRAEWPEARPAGRSARRDPTRRPVRHP